MPNTNLLRTYLCVFSQYELMRVLIVNIESDTLICSVTQSGGGIYWHDGVISFVLFNRFFSKPGTRTRRREKYQVNFDVAWAFIGTYNQVGQKVGSRVLKLSKVFRSTFVSDQNSKIYLIIK